MKYINSMEMNRFENGALADSFGNGLFISYMKRNKVTGFVSTATVLTETSDSDLGRHCVRVT